MEHQSLKAKFMSYEEIRAILAELEAEEEGEEFLVSSEDEEPLDSVDVRDDRDPGFNPGSASSSESENEGFDLEVEEEALANNICCSEELDVEENLAESPHPKSKGLKRKNPARADKAKKQKNITADGHSSKKDDEFTTTDCLISFDCKIVFGKQNKHGTAFTWQTEPMANEGSKLPKKNSVHIRPGPVGHARNADEPIDCFSLFITPQMLEIILKHTNEEIRRIETNTPTSREIHDVAELKALIGLTIYSGAKQDNHLPTSLLFNIAQCGYWYRASMSIKRFEFLLRALRFDDKETRNAGEKFAPIAELWKLFLDECKNCYKPGTYVTIDEQLVGFRGKCPFRTYLPSKPAKYGLKITAMVDSSTKYLIDAIPYTGKGSTPPNEPAAANLVKQLVKSIENTNRNVTIDNWFTSIPLVSDLLQKGLTVVGTIRKDKIELPPNFINLKYKNRKIGSSLFLFHSDMTAVSFKAKENKLVTLVSSMHDKPELHPFSRKPHIIHTYNATKRGVDTLDQLCAHSSCSRKTKRWPLCFFYNMLNIACANSFVIYLHNFHRKRKENVKPLTRLEFMIKLHEQLSFEWKQTRLQNISINRILKPSITETIKQSDTQSKEMGASGSSAANPGEQDPSTIKIKKTPYKGNCQFCPSALRKKGTTTCAECQVLVCGGHIGKKLCQDCSSK